MCVVYRPTITKILLMGVMLLCLNCLHIHLCTKKLCVYDICNSDTCVTHTLLIAVENYFPYISIYPCTIQAKALTGFMDILCGF